MAALGYRRQARLSVSHDHSSLQFPLEPCQSSGIAITYSATVAPITSSLHRADSNTITYTANKSNALLRITWRVTVIADSANKIFIAGITRDLVSAALDWVQFADPGNGWTFEYQFWTTAPDASAHTYGGRCWHDTAGPNSIVSFSRSTLTIEEFASRHLAKCGF